MAEILEDGTLKISVGDPFWCDHTFWIRTSRGFLWHYKTVDKYNQPIYYPVPLVDVTCQHCEAAKPREERDMKCPECGSSNVHVVKLCRAIGFKKASALLRKKPGSSVIERAFACACFECCHTWEQKDETKLRKDIWVWFYKQACKCEDRFVTMNATGQLSCLHCHSSWERDYYIMKEPVEKDPSA